MRAGTQWVYTESGEAEAVVTIEASAAGQRHVIETLSGYTDLDGAVLEVLHGEDVVWKMVLLTAQPFAQTFPEGIVGPANTDVVVQITGSAQCGVNVTGRTL